jgi:LysR family transcriptional activator of nhaA
MLRIEVGVSDVLPRWIVYQLLEPAFRLDEPVQLICYDDKTERLLSRLALNELDVVLADVPAGPLVKIRAYNHLLGECGISFLAADKSASHFRKNFPKSLDQQPFIFPLEGTALRRSLDQWLESERIRPVIKCEVGDRDLFEVLGHAGEGVFATPTILEHRIRKQFAVRVVGRVESIRERYYAISTERKLKHPAVIAISEGARTHFAR